MKCPVCGTENKSTNKACFKCAQSLGDNSVQPKGNVNSLWYNKSETKPRQSPPPFWGDTTGKPTYEDGSDFIVLHDEASESNAAQDLVDRGAPVPDNRQKLQWMKGRREVRVVVPANPPPPVEAPRTRRYRIRWPRLVLTTMAILIAFVGVGYGVFLLYRLVSGSLADLAANSKGNAADREPRVEKVMINGDSWHRITFYGKDGEMVLVNDPKRSLPIQNGQAELLLNDQGYIPDDQAEKVTVSLEAMILSPDNKERKVLIPPYSIEVPLSPLKIVLPKEQSITTNEDSMLIKIKVLPGSERVLIGGHNVTDNVNSEGFVSATLDIKPDGINTILIVVETGKHRRNNFELKVNRPVMDVPIKLEGSTASSTGGSTVLISGSTVAGAAISTDAPLSGKITIDNNGIFLFTAKLIRWGWNAISITATDTSGRSSTMVHRVNRVPALDSYTRSALALGDSDFNYLTSAAENLIGRIYKLEGTVVRKLESEESDYFLYNIGSADETKLMVVEYSKEEGLKPDLRYSIFADVTGTFDGFPLLTARFVYPKEPLAGQSASPGATASVSPSPTPTAAN